MSELQRERDVKRLEEKLGPWFKWQGRVLVAALPKLVRYFPQPVEESRLLEALGADFDAMFDSAIEVTVSSGEEILTKGLDGAMHSGYTDLAEEIRMAKAFQLDDPLATAWAKERAAEAVSQVNDTTKETIRGIVSKGIEEGMDYDTIAGRITKRFGEFAIGKPQQHIQSRAHLVAINENALAYEHGQRQLVDEIQATGIDMEKSWATVGDGDVSAGCQRNQDAEWVPAAAEFPSGDQNPPRFPGCRCSSRHRVAREQEEEAI